MKYYLPVGIVSGILILGIFFNCQSGNRSSFGEMNPSRENMTSNKELTDVVLQNNEYPSPIEVRGVIDFSSPEYHHLWQTSPRDGKMIFFASTPRRELREEEINYCVMDAARQISLYYAAKVKTKQAVESTGKNFGYLESVESGFDRKLARKEIPKIKVLEYFRDSEGSYIIAEDPGLISDITFSWDNADNNLPDWITNVPVIHGYLVSVGVVQRSRYVTDSLKKADDQALANLSRQISINVKSKRTDMEIQKRTAYSQTHYEVSSSILKGFYVLGRWSTDHGNTFYTLAVCKQGIGS